MRRFVLCAFLATLVSWFVPQAAVTELRVAGSTTLTPFAEEAAWRSHLPLAVYAVGTFAGWSLLRRGLVDIALADIGLPGSGLRTWLVGRLPVPLLVHCGLRLSALTRAQLIRLLEGRTTSWRAFGGPDLPVRLVFRTAVSGLGWSLRRQLLGRAPLGTEVIRAQSQGEVARIVAVTPGALGFADPGTVAGCGLRLDGKRPTDAGYPLRIEAWVYSRRSSPDVLRFVTALRRVLTP